LTATTAGDRLEVAARRAYAPREGLPYSVFGQNAGDANGLAAFNRLGLGVAAQVSENWTLEAELSDGTGGIGARVLATRKGENNSSTYFGYELDAGRAIDAGVAQSDNGGKYVLGARQHLNEDVVLVTENSYDIFGSAQNLTSVYGVEYTQNDFLRYSAALEIGHVTDDVNGDFDRSALSFGLRYEDSKLTARTRIELRREVAGAGSSRDDLDAVFVTANARYQIDNASRLLFSLDAADTISTEGSLLNGTLVDLSLGYALRPVTNERLNMLASYRYLYDMFGQQVDGVAGAGPVQESHVANVEVSYDLNRQWTLGGKVGGRWTQSAAQAGDPFASNDAWLGIANLRYNVVHNWDAMIEARHLYAVDAGLSETGALAAVYRHFGNNAKVGIGYNFSSFSDDLTDLTNDDQGVFINLIAKF
jgi:hypothetical protein